MKSSYPDGHPHYGVGPENGVHILRNNWGQRSYIEEQSQALVPGIAAAIGATRQVVPRRAARGKNFRIDEATHRTRIQFEDMDHSNEERLMEQALYLAYGPTGKFGMSAVWNQLIAFQVPLYDKRLRNGWGHIDLLALTMDGRPAVIELKKHSSQETPMRAMLEGLANAIVVEENWSAISSEIRAMCEVRNMDVQVAEKANPVNVMVIAPETYWRNWQREGILGQGVNPNARDGFRNLRASLFDAGYPTQMATFDWPFEDDPQARAAIVDW